MHLARHVPWCTDNRCAFGSSVVHHSDDAKIAELDLSIFGDVDICALDIAMDDPNVVHTLHGNSQLACDRDDEVLLKWGRWVRAHEGAHTAASAIVAHNPELRVKVKGVMYQIDIACATILELLKNAHFLAKVFDGFVALAGISTEVHVINVDNFDSHQR